MMNVTRIVPVTLALTTAALILTACGSNNVETTSTRVQPASKQSVAQEDTPAAQPPATAQAAANQKSASGNILDNAPQEVRDKLKATQDTSSKADAHDGHDHAHDHSHAVAATSASSQSSEHIVKAEPSVLDLGEIPTNDSKTGTVKLVNTGDKPMTLLSARASCGCTALRVTPNTIIPAGETLEIEVQMQGGPRPMQLRGKTVTFVIEGQPDLVVPLQAQAISFVVMEPAELDPEVQTDGKFVIRSIDDQPFRIMSMQPPVITEFDSEAKARHELTISWDRFREIGAQPKVTFYLDHPKCQQVMSTVKFKPQELAQRTPRPRTELKGVESPRVPQDENMVLANLINSGKNDEVLQRVSSGSLDVNHRDNSGATLLSLAAKAGNVELIKGLISAKADIEAADNAGRTPLMWAAQSKNVAAVQTLLDAGASPTARDTLGGTALSWAAGMGDAASVKALLDAGSEVEVVGAVTGWTPLMWAASFGEPESVALLLDAKADIEATDLLQGTTPLMQAARTGKVETIKLLIARGADLEAKDRNGNTALLTAAANSGGDAVKVQALIDAGANVKAKDNRGYNALELARKRTDIRADAVIKLLEPLLADETPAVAAEGASKPAAPQSSDPKPGAN